MEQLDTVTQRNTASSEESASASQDLRFHADALLEGVRRFQLKEE